MRVCRTEAWSHMSPHSEAKAFVRDTCPQILFTYFRRNPWWIYLVDALNSVHDANVESGFKMNAYLLDVTTTHTDGRRSSAGRRTRDLLSRLRALLKCEHGSEKEFHGVQRVDCFWMRNSNAILMSGQLSFSGNETIFFVFCCGGYKGWSRVADYLHEHEGLAISSLEVLMWMLCALTCVEETGTIKPKLPNKQPKPNKPKWKTWTRTMTTGWTQLAESGLWEMLRTSLCGNKCHAGNPCPLSIFCHYRQQQGW